MANYVFGVDVGGTTVKLGLFDISGNLLDKWIGRASCRERV